jgi:hypothetical protein
MMLSLSELNFYNLSSSKVRTSDTLFKYKYIYIYIYIYTYIDNLESKICLDFKGETSIPKEYSKNLQVRDFRK